MTLYLEHPIFIDPSLDSPACVVILGRAVKTPGHVDPLLAIAGVTEKGFFLFKIFCCQTFCEQDFTPTCFSPKVSKGGRADFGSYPSRLSPQLHSAPLSDPLSYVSAPPPLIPTLLSYAPPLILELGACGIF